MTLKDKVALVTGAGRGLGAATALRLAKEGAHIVVNDISKENASQICGEIEKLGRKALLNNHDISDHKQAASMIEETVKAFGRLDVLVNNAGITRDALLHKLEEAQWDEVIRINLKGVFNVGQAAAKVMMNQKSGTIVNLASVAAFGNIGQTNYSASKAGVIGMTITWAKELSKHNIRVNAIAPGMIDSVLTRQVPTEVMDKFVQKIPLKRIGKPEEIASLIHFLSCDESSYITGQCIVIDGGLSAGI